MSDKSSIRYILTLSIPIFFANLAIPLVGIVDTALMGNMSDQSYLTATSIASSFLFQKYEIDFLKKNLLQLIQTNMLHS